MCKVVVWCGLVGWGCVWCCLLLVVEVLVFGF